MPAVPREILVEPDTFQVAKGAVLLTAHLQCAVAIALHDDSQGIGGLLHLRYVATRDGKPLELTDNTLSSSVLLIDRFCKDMKTAGSRAQWWRVRIIAHLAANDTDAAAATVLDLVRAYFVDSAKPVTCQEIRKLSDIAVRLHAREGQIWTNGLTTADRTASLANTG